MLRAPTTSAALRSGLSRAGRRTTAGPLICRAAASTHAISNPTLANIEKRWEGMPLQEQAELWMALRDRMKENWKDLTLQEKKAGECCPGPPSAPLPPSCAAVDMSSRITLAFSLVFPMAACCSTTVQQLPTILRA